MKKYNVCGDNLTFSELVAIAVGPESDLPHEVRGLLLFADVNSSEDEIDTFMEWLGDNALTTINPVSTKPGDHFLSAEGFSWDDMERGYREFCGQ